jgi:thiamine biosynthesis lipoprotein
MKLQVAGCCFFGATSTSRPTVIVNCHYIAVIHQVLGGLGSARVCGALCGGLFPSPILLPKRQNNVKINPMTALKHAQKTALMLLIFILTLLAFLPTNTAAATTPADVSGDIYDLQNEDDKSHEGVTFSQSYFADLTLGISVFDDALKKNSPAAIAVFSEIDAFMYKMDAVANAANLNSEVSKYNQLPTGGTLPVSVEFAEMLSVAREIHDLTDGAFDPTAYRLVDLWGFSSRVSGREILFPQPYDGKFSGLPTQNYIDAFKQLCDFDSVILTTATDGTNILTKTCPSVTVDGETFQQWMDLGGIAKGYIVDKVENILARHGFKHYYINFAASSIAYTTRQDGSSFEIALQDPTSFFDGYAGLTVPNSTLSTSGTYVRFFEYRGKRYSHLLNPKTGYPVDNGIAAVTIFGGGSGYADCLTTALTVMGAEGIVEFVNGEYCRANNLKISAYLADERWAAGNDQIITNIDANEFTFIKDDVTLATKTTVVDGKTVVVYTDPVNSTGVLIIAVVAAAALLLTLCVVKFIKNRRANRTEKVTKVKSDKYFKLADTVIYALVVALIVVLFAVFVFNGSSENVTSVVVRSTLTGETLFTYDVATDKYATFLSANYTVDATDNSAATVVTITTTDGHYNTLTITKGATVTAKMTDALCGIHKECVNNFPAITRDNGVIVCSPNGIKVTTAGSSYILV